LRLLLSIEYYFSWWRGTVSGPPNDIDTSYHLEAISHETAGGYPSRRVVGMTREDERLSESGRYADGQVSRRLQTGMVMR
jgi:hypothetical protein